MEAQEGEEPLVVTSPFGPLLELKDEILDGLESITEPLKHVEFITLHIDFEQPHSFDT